MKVRPAALVATLACLPACHHCINNDVRNRVFVVPFNGPQCNRKNQGSLMADRSVVEEDDVPGCIFRMKAKWWSTSVFDLRNDCGKPDSPSGCLTSSDFAMLPFFDDEKSADILDMMVDLPPRACDGVKNEAKEVVCWKIKDAKHGEVSFEGCRAATDKVFSAFGVCTLTPFATFARTVQRFVAMISSGFTTRRSFSVLDVASANAYFRSTAMSASLVGPRCSMVFTTRS